MRHIREPDPDEITNPVNLGLQKLRESGTLRPEMKMIGLKEPLRSEALRHFGWEFRVWINEVQRIDFPGWGELLEFYPTAQRTGNDRAHFPLADDGSGITADVFFEPVSFILLQEVVLLAPRTLSTASDHSH